MAKPTPEQIADELASENEEAILFDGFLSALVGICYQFGRPPVACYNYEQCLALLIDQGMDQEQAREYFEYNTLGSGLGENTPVVVNLFTNYL